MDDDDEIADERNKVWKWKIFPHPYDSEYDYLVTDDDMSKQSFCWHCGGKLKLPYFAEITDPIGNTHKVHKVCADDAKESMRVMSYEERHTCQATRSSEYRT